MKKLSLFITTLVLTLTCMQSHAAMISLSTDRASYEVGDTVLLSISLDDLNSDTQTLGFDLNFDETALSFDIFNFSTDVLSSAFLAFNTLSPSNNSINFYVSWMFSSIPSTSFSLGQISFTATQAYTPMFAVTDAYLQNVTGEEFDLSSVSVPVPAPASVLLMMFALVLFPLKKKLLANGK